MASKLFEDINCIIKNQDGVWISSLSSEISSIFK